MRADVAHERLLRWGYEESERTTRVVMGLDGVRYFDGVQTYGQTDHLAEMLPGD